MTVLEIQPGGASWWTEILAPYAQAHGGSFDATGRRSRRTPKLSDDAKQARNEFEQRYAAKPDLYGDVGIVNWGLKSRTAAGRRRYDFILTARSVHGWMRTPGHGREAFEEFSGALKPGGILAVEQHRANPGPQDPEAESGYVTEAFVIEQAEKAGFKLAARSEINANPRTPRIIRSASGRCRRRLRSTPYGDDQTDPDVRPLEVHRDRRVATA